MAVRADESWPNDKKRILLVFSARNMKTQGALARKFPKVVDKFDIAKIGIEGAAFVLKSLKPGAVVVSSGAGTTPSAR